MVYNAMVDFIAQPNSGNGLPKLNNKTQKTNKSQATMT